MIVRLERSGGVAGRTARWSVETGALAPDRQAELQRLLGQAAQWPQAAAADRFGYRLVTEQPGAVGLDVRFGEPLTGPARRLVELIRAGSG